MNKILDLLAQGRCAIFTPHRDRQGNSISILLANLYAGRFNSEEGGISFESSGRYILIPPTVSADELYAMIIRESRSNFGIYRPQDYIPRVADAARLAESRLAPLRAEFPYLCMINPPKFTLGLKFSMSDPMYELDEEAIARRHIKVVNYIWDALPMPIAEEVAREFGYDINFDQYGAFIELDKCGISITDSMCVDKANEVYVCYYEFSFIQPRPKTPAEVLKSNDTETWFKNACSYRVDGWRPPPQNQFADYPAKLRAYAEKYPLCSQLIALVIDHVTPDYDAIETRLRECNWTP